MVQRLSRTKLAAICRAFDGGELGARSTYKSITPREFLVKNAGNTAITEGSPLTVTAFASNLSYADARRRINNASIVLSGIAGGSMAIASELIPSGKIGRATSIGLTFHDVTITDASYDYANTNFTTVGSIDYYQIVAKSGTSNGVARCALYHEPQGGGGGTLTASVSNNVLTLEIV